MTPPKTTNWALLVIAVAIMTLLLGYPLLVVGSSGKVQYAPLLLLLLSMTAGFVRGVGFIPKSTIIRFILSGITCLVAIVIAVGLFAFQRPSLG